MIHDQCLYEEDDINEIIPGLYLGNLNAARNKKLLDKYNIKFIICAMLDINKTVIYSNVKYLHVPIKDYMIPTIDTNDLLDYTTRYINDNLKNGNILVHCKRGHHRSASIVGDYMLSKYRIKFDNMIKYINTKRNCAFRRDTNMTKRLYERHSGIIDYNINKGKYITFIPRN